MWADTAMMDISTDQGLQGLDLCVGCKSADEVVDSYILLFLNLNGMVPQNHKLISDLGINKFISEFISS